MTSSNGISDAVPDQGIGAGLPPLPPPRRLPIILVGLAGLFVFTVLVGLFLLFSGERARLAEREAAALRLEQSVSGLEQRRDRLTDEIAQFEVDRQAADEAQKKAERAAKDAERVKANRDLALAEAPSVGRQSE